MSIFTLIERIFKLEKFRFLFLYIGVGYLLKHVSTFFNYAYIFWLYNYCISNIFWSLNNNCLSFLIYLDIIFGLNIFLLHFLCIHFRTIIFIQFTKKSITFFMSTKIRRRYFFLIFF